jgi:hypothetical protein
MSETLSLKQLQDASECKGKRCVDCSMYDKNFIPCIMRLAKIALAYREILERHVWHKRSSDGKEFCIECRNLKKNGHTKSCELVKLLGD